MESKFPDSKGINKLFFHSFIRADRYLNCKVYFLQVSFKMSKVEGQKVADWPAFIVLKFHNIYSINKTEQKRNTP